MSDVRIVRHAEGDPATAQTPGMRRLAGVAPETCGAAGIWLGEASTGPGFRSGAHHHGDVESAIYVLGGRLRMRWGERLQHEADAAAGDYIYVPAGLVHQEINASPDAPVTMIVARGGDNIVINVDMPEAAAG